MGCVERRIPASESNFHRHSREFAAVRICKLCGGCSLKYSLAETDNIIEGDNPMMITDYLVQSLLRTYGKRLQRRSRDAGRVESDEIDDEITRERMVISDDVRRRMVMERMTSLAIEKAYPREEVYLGGERSPDEENSLG
jgi:hypothetical protein